MTKKMRTFILFLGMFVFLSPSVFAHSISHRGGSQCESQCPITNKFMMKSHFILENKSEIGLTEDQVKAIKALKLQTEKDSIKQTADMKTFMLDLQSKLAEDKVDVEGTNALIDKSFASASEGAKSNLAAYAKLKSLLTPDQVTKMKALHEKMEKHEKEEGEDN